MAEAVRFKNAAAIAPLGHDHGLYALLKKDLCFFPDRCPLRTDEEKLLGIGDDYVDGS